jgi:3-deoxy-D-manno-octulosonic-acid transferase
MAYIGGGFGKGIHNILEAAAFGLPVIFGPNFKKFREAADLISVGGAFSGKSSSEVREAVVLLMDNESLLKKASAVSESYVREGTGATEKIISAIILH